MKCSRPQDRTGSGRPPRGFTLIEVLVVILVLAILVALVVGTGKTVMIEIGRRKTAVTLDIVMNAVKAYQEARGFYPAEGIPNASLIPAIIYGDNTYYGTTGWWSGITGAFSQEQMAAKIRNAVLYDQLMAEPASARKMQFLPPEAVYSTTKWFFNPADINNPLPVSKVIRDGYDCDIDYRSSAGLGGRPVVISPGPNGYFFRDNNKDYDVDNIRSDGQGR